jgi:hypothetical protein
MLSFYLETENGDLYLDDNYIRSELISLAQATSKEENILNLTGADFSTKVFIERLQVDIPVVSSSSAADIMTKVLSSFDNTDKDMFYSIINMNRIYFLSIFFLIKNNCLPVNDLRYFITLKTNTTRAVYLLSKLPAETENVDLFAPLYETIQNLSNVTNSDEIGSSPSMTEENIEKNILSLNIPIPTEFKLYCETFNNLQNQEHSYNFFKYSGNWEYEEKKKDENSKIDIGLCICIFVGLITGGLGAVVGGLGAVAAAAAGTWLLIDKIQVNSYSDSVNIDYKALIKDFYNGAAVETMKDTFLNRLNKTYEVKYDDEYLLDSFRVCVGRNMTNLLVQNKDYRKFSPFFWVANPTADDLTKYNYVNPSYYRLMRLIYSNVSNLDSSEQNKKYVTKKSEALTTTDKYAIIWNSDDLINKKIDFSKYGGEQFTEPNADDKVLTDPYTIRRFLNGENNTDGAYYDFKFSPDSTLTEPGSYLAYSYDGSSNASKKILSMLQNNVKTFCYSGNDFYNFYFLGLNLTSSIDYLFKILAYFPMPNYLKNILKTIQYSQIKNIIGKEESKEFLRNDYIIVKNSGTTINIFNRDGNISIESRKFTGFVNFGKNFDLAKFRTFVNTFVIKDQKYILNDFLVESNRNNIINQLKKNLEDSISNNNNIATTAADSNNIPLYYELLEHYFTFLINGNTESLDSNNAKVNVDTASNDITFIPIVSDDFYNYYKLIYFIRHTIFDLPKLVSAVSNSKWFQAFNEIPSIQQVQDA